MLGTNGQKEDAGEPSVSAQEINPITYSYSYRQTTKSECECRSCCCPSKQRNHMVTKVTSL